MGVTILFPIIVVLIIVSLSMKAAVGQAKKHRKAAAEIAPALGLTLREESFQKPGGGVRKEDVEESEQIERAMKSPLGGFLKDLVPWRLEGEYGGAAVVIRKVSRGSGKNQHSYTRYEAALKRPAGFSLAISSEDFFSRVGKSVLGLQDIETGNPELDRLVKVKSDNEIAARSWLSSSMRQHALITLFAQYPGTEVSAAAVSLEERGFSPNLEEYRRVLDAISSCVKGLE